MFSRDENDLRNLRRQGAYRAHRRPAGGLRGKPDAGMRLALGLRHFPISENPPEFFKHLLPVLEKIGQMAI
jgi:hypothetical protein